MASKFNDTVWKVYLIYNSCHLVLNDCKLDQVSYVACRRLSNLDCITSSKKSNGYNQNIELLILIFVLMIVFHAW
jgi:hypothetical protein